ncbi:peptidylprolyl isomerase [Sphingosinicella humi]|uniref:Peptidyl-prolyl cis-trans isomerase n=1 Tax=Allosphingosinicella humi TaxID=2068657 RepID=A0A2U2IZS9_9SPHN|nr:peptidylprolyl isomerase [Sphingosinicella humi]PWG01586.1 peptidylprolyl isomerase [Sphingosinicella humi]
MKLKSLLAALAALFFAGFAAAQEPATPAPSPAVTPELTPENTWHLDLSTGGRVSIQLRPDFAPNHVERIKTLTRQGFYDGIIFHRVIEGFMAQTGDPTGTGQGGSELPDLAPEFNALPHVRGTVAAARAQDPNSANSQFYIMLAPRLSLDGDYTVFGRVVGGMQYVDSIARGEPPLEPSRIVRASIGSDNVAPMTAAELQAAAAQQAAAAAAARPAPEPFVQSLTDAPITETPPAEAVADESEAEPAAESTPDAETAEEPETADTPQA